MPLAILSAFLFFSSITIASCAGLQADFYVAPGGNDSWSGTRPGTAPDGADGPFATPARAAAAVRQLRTEQPDRARDVVVMLRGGDYFLDKPFELTPADSGTRASRTVWTNYPGESPRISGGRVISGWKKGGAAWEADIPQVRDGGWRFSQLWVNGNRRYRPRLPKSGFYNIAEELEPTAENVEKGYDRFRYTGEDIRPEWAGSDAEVLIFQTWTMARLPIEAVDPAERIVNFGGTSAGKLSFFKFATGNRYLVENVKDALSEPGEWYLDRETGALSYIPMPGEDPATWQVIAPVSDLLVTINGNPAAGQPVEHIVFRGITFSHTNWNLPAVGYQAPQAEVTLPGAVRAVGAQFVEFDGCTFEHLGTYGLELAEGCKHNRVMACVLRDLGAGGIKIGSMGIAEDAVTASHNVVSNCVLAHGGRMHPAGIGVWVGQSFRNRITHNTIRDFYYTGVSMGWTWGYGKSQTHHNTVEFNHIHDIGQGLLSDMGGIYTLGISPGSELRRNRIHDINSFGYGGWGIYFDEGTTHMVARDNVVFRTKSAGFHQHYGRENLVENNIFAYGREAQIMRTRPEEHLSFTFGRNIVLYKDAPLLGSNWSGDNYRLDHNLYWNESGQQPQFAQWSLEEWRAKGQDVNSLIAPPHLANPAGGDFRLTEQTPADEIGFRAFDQSKYGSSLKEAASGQAPAFPL